jgi:hypothetical protein
MVTVVIPEGLGGTVVSLKGFSFLFGRGPRPVWPKAKFSQIFNVFCDDL